MATIYSTGPNNNSSAAADDGNISSGGSQGGTSWPAVRSSSGSGGLAVDDGIDGTGSTDVEKGAYAYVRAASVGAGRGLRYHCVRSFFHFDTSSTSNCTALTLDLMGFQGGAYSTGKLIVLDSDAFGHGDENALSTGDWDGIPGWNGNGSSNMSGATEYSTVFPPSGGTWTHSGQYNVITLNAAAVSAVNNQTHFIIALVDYAYDYQGNTPLAGGTGSALVASNALDVALGGYHNDFGNANRRPRLSLTIAAPSGYGNIVNTVLATNIGKVNTVATADIEKINTVD